MSNNMWARLDNCYIAGAMAIGYNIIHRNKEEYPIVEHFHGEGHTLADMSVMAIDKYTATTHVFARYGKAGGSGLLVPCILWE